MLKNARQFTLFVLAMIIVLALSGCSAISEWQAEQNLEKALELQTSGEVEQALEAYGKALEANPLLVQAYFERARLLIDQQRATLALPDLEKTFELDPQNAEAAFLAASILQDQGDPQAALPYLDATLKLEPTNDQAYYRRAQVYLSREDNDQALADLDKAIANGLKDAEAYKQRGLLLVEAGEHAKAAADFGQVIELEPESHSAYFERAKSYQAMDQALKACEDYHMAIDQGSQEPQAYLQRAVCHNTEGEDALADLDQAIQLDNTLSEAYYQRALLQQAKGEYELAGADYDRVAELTPDQEGLYARRGETRLELGLLDQALEDLDKALESAEKDLHLLTLRGYTHFLLEDMEAAQKDFAQVVRIEPKNPSSLYNLGLAEARLGNLKAAADRLKQSLYLEESALAHRARGDVLYANDDLAGAIEEIDAANDLDSIDRSMPQLLLQSALLHLLSGELKDAVREAGDYLKLKPEDDHMTAVEEWKDILDAQLKGETKLDFTDMAAIDRQVPDGFSEDVEAGRDVTKSLGQYVTGDFKRMMADSLVYANPETEALITVTPFNLSQEDDRKMFLLDILGSAINFEGDARSKEIVGLEVGEASFGYCEQRGAVTVCPVTFLRGPVGISLGVFYSTDSPLSAEEIAQAVDQQIIANLIATLPYYPLGEQDLLNLPALKE